MKGLARLQKETSRKSLDSEEKRWKRCILAAGRYFKGDGNSVASRQMLYFYRVSPGHLDILFFFNDVLSQEFCL